MPERETFRCQLITPEAAVADVQATAVVFTAHDGEIGVLRDRAPLLCKLGIGGLRIAAVDGALQYFIDGGFAHVLDNHVVLLTERAIESSRIDQARAQQELHDLQLSKVTGLDAVQQRTDDIKRAGMKVKLAELSRRSRPT